MKKNTPKKEKDKKPEGGAPPPSPEKPKPVNFTPAFTQDSLIFDGQYTIDNRKYVRFFIDGDSPYFITTTKAEYLDYLSTFMDMFEKAIEENKDCLCDTCSPLGSELIEQIPITKVSVDVKNDNKESEVETSFPLYSIWNMNEGIKISIHDKEEHKNIKK